MDWYWFWWAGLPSLASLDLAGILLFDVGSVGLVSSISIGRLFTSGCLLLHVSGYSLPWRKPAIPPHPWNNRGWLGACCLGTHGVGPLGPIFKTTGASLVDRQHHLCWNFSVICRKTISPFNSQKKILTENGELEVFWNPRKSPNQNTELHQRSNQSRRAQYWRILIIVLSIKSISEKYRFFPGAHPYASSQYKLIGKVRTINAFCRDKGNPPLWVGIMGSECFYLLQYTEQFIFLPPCFFCDLNTPFFVTSLSTAPHKYPWELVLPASAGKVEIHLRASLV